MQIPRIYQNQSIIEGQPCQLDSAGSRHLSTVLRLQVGARVILFNGLGGEYHGAITAVSNKLVTVTPEFFNEHDRASPVKVHLGQVIGKGDRMDFAIQKAVELGVSEITPLLSHRCEVRLKGPRLEKKLEQWRQLIIAACEQSGLNLLPTLNTPQPLTNWAAQVTAERKWILHTAEIPHSPFAGAIPKSVCVAIGPEGGFDDSEVETVHSHGFHAVTLGPRVWRTETAPAVILGLIQWHWGDFIETAT